MGSLPQGPPGRSGCELSAYSQGHLQWGPVRTSSSNIQCPAPERSNTPTPVCDGGRRGPACLRRPLNARSRGVTVLYARNEPSTGVSYTSPTRGTYSAGPEL